MSRLSYRVPNISCKYSIQILELNSFVRLLSRNQSHQFKLRHQLKSHAVKESHFGKVKHADLLEIESHVEVGGRVGDGSQDEVVAKRQTTSLYKLESI